MAALATPSASACRMSPRWQARNGTGSTFSPLLTCWRRPADSSLAGGWVAGAYIASHATAVASPQSPTARLRSS
eukprot:4265253-Pleurochrysis_carterae.AAC.1